MFAAVLAGLPIVMALNQRPHGGMQTAWTKDALQNKGWSEYPRPQMRRKEWANLNGEWDLQFADGAVRHKIRVPYPVESLLGGVNKRVSPADTLLYSRSFTVPPQWKDKSVWLHFGAVDWQAKVYLNGQLLGEHKGGFTPFSFDVSQVVKDGPNELVVEVKDPTDTFSQPRGKQVLKPSGIWYTAVSGIWQTVWVEPVPTDHFESVRVETRSIRGAVQIVPKVSSTRGLTCAYTVYDGARAVATHSAPAGESPTITVPAPKLWSPESPHRYRLVSALKRGGETLDTVTSMFGIRTMEVRKDLWGERFYLNGKPIFMVGPLDQGWWPDGLYTPPTEQAMRYDLEVTKAMGFNTVRKHVKVEPAVWYEACDKLGLLVWQDMPSTTSHGPRWVTSASQWNPAADGDRPPDSASVYRTELKEMLDFAMPFTSVVMWVPFNESWGQFDTVKTALWIKQYDPYRLVNSASGGNFTDSGDVLDVHIYPGPGAPKKTPGKVSVLGEFGGLGLGVKGHVWQDDGNWGYVSYADQDQLAKEYTKLIDALYWLKSEGLSAAIYTQTTDVEIEINGLMTYDRAVVKMKPESVKAANLQLGEEPMALKPLAPTAAEGRAVWSFLDGQPDTGWQLPGHNDSNWSTGPGGFGTPQTPGAIVGTVWDNSDIWLRRWFQVSQVPKKAFLKIHHDEDVEVFLNGKPLWEFKGYRTGYILVKLDPKLLTKGKNLLAIHCHQTTGGQYIDAGVLVPE